MDLSGGGGKAGILHARCYSRAVVGRDELMALLSRALREHLPDAAEARLRELERATSTAADIAAAAGPRPDDLAVAMNRIERETPGGARGAWTIVVSGGAVHVRAEASRESLQRNVDQILTPLVKQGLPPEAAAAIPALQPLLGALRGAIPGQSPLDLLTSVLTGLEAPPKDSAIVDAEAALTACFPERAEELLVALKRRMPLFAPPLERVDLREPVNAATEGLALAEVAVALATRVEDRQTGGARYRWTARQRGAALEILREPIG